MHVRTCSDDAEGDSTIVTIEFSDAEFFTQLEGHQNIAPAIHKDIQEDLPDTRTASEQPDWSQTGRLTSIELLLRMNLPCYESLPTLPSSKDLEEKSIAMMTSIKDPVETNATLHYYAPDHITESPGDGQQRPLRPFIMYDPKEFLKSRNSLVLRHPNLRLEVLDAISKVNQKSKRATVWLTCRLSRYSIADMKAKESVVRLHWRCVESLGWICVKTLFIHGPGYFA